MQRVYCVYETYPTAAAEFFIMNNEAACGSKKIKVKTQFLSSGRSHWLMQ